MKIDLHLHAKERSSCSNATEKQHIEAAIKLGLDAIVFTDHDKLVPLEHLKELNKKYYPFKIFGGIEVRLCDSGEDFLVLGLHDNILQENKWTYEKLYKYVKENNGFIALAHPYRYVHSIASNIEKYVPDAIEIHSTNIGKDDSEDIKKLAEKLNTRLISNSDGHDSKYVGIYYNDIEGNPETDAGLIALLKAGKYKHSCFEPARIEEFNNTVKEREAIIKKLIKENKDRKYYHELTGNWEGEFDRVALGKSREI